MTLQEIAKLTLADGSAVKAEVACQVVRARENVTKAGKPYLDVEISDGTAAEKFKIWEDADAYESFHDLEDGDCVRIDGSFWRNQYGLNIDRLRVRRLEKQEAAELFAGTPERRAALERDWEDISSLVAAIGDPRLRLLSQTYLAEHGEKFRRAAAARDYHHARRGGLLEHTAQMMRAGAALGPVYPGLNWDLVRTGILFHDCGKLWEIDYQPQGFVSPMTTMGELLGHITIGIELVNKLWRGLEASAEFSAPAQPPREMVREHLLHLIASHHGQKEYGAPVTPRTPEAWMLHHIDNIDAHLEMLSQTYAEKTQIAPGIYDYRRPLEGRAVAPLTKWAPAEGSKSA
ncbi:MAG TPA: HD domain-containing protein [Candidatus Methylacidiphilales bacterium]|nr:HD domain-containing protein [Candidatus Methylacidiphilales bacterium]